MKFSLFTVCCTLSNYSNLRVFLLNSAKFRRCECGNCSTELLSNALEFRCCKEVAAAMAKLTFEGLEGSCVLDHTDFDALTNATLLSKFALFWRTERVAATNFLAEELKMLRMSKYLCFCSIAPKFILTTFTLCLTWVDVWMQLLDGELSESKKKLNKTYKGISKESSTILRDEELSLVKLQSAMFAGVKSLQRN